MGTESIDLERLRRELELVDLLTEQRKARASDSLELVLVRREPLRLKIYQEDGHQRPHIHVEYGPDFHAASYAIDTGERLAGRLKPKYDRVVQEWTQENREPLLAVWMSIQEGREGTEFLKQLGPLD